MGAYAGRSLSAGLVVVLLMGSMAVAHAARQLDAPDSGYWHTDGTRIVDANGNPVRLAGVTWYGMESSHWVPAGLDFQPYTVILDIVKRLGYNAVRIPLSDELVERDPPVTSGVRANPQFHGLHALQVLDAIVQYAGTIGLKVVLDNHRSRAGRPMTVNTLDEPLWYTAQYPEAAWIHDWETLARRYLGNDAVIGFDLRNEPHTDGPGPWTLHAYLTQGATWGPYGGVDNPATDWRLAAERAGNAVLAINPHLLIFVEGIELYPDASQPRGIASGWWAEMLSAVRRYPVVFDVPHQLVYSPHEYGPRKAEMPWFKHLSYSSLLGAWQRMWAFIQSDAASPYAAPVWIGEFGTCNVAVSCVRSSVPGSQGAWFHLLLRFLRQHATVGWDFYTLNGTNSNNCATDNGLLTWGWNTLASPALQRALASAQDGPPAAPPVSGSLVPNSPPADTPRSPTSPLCTLPLAR